MKPQLSTVVQELLGVPGGFFITRYFLIAVDSCSHPQIIGAESGSIGLG